MFGKTYRFHQDYELLHFERLGTAERERLGDLEPVAGAFGLLRQRAPGGVVEAVGNELALLLLALREPGPLPAFAQRLGEGELLRLVLDGILEIETERGFVSGAPACEHLNGLSPAPAREGALGELSWRALRSVARLPSSDVSEIAAKLYRYNTQPRCALEGSFDTAAEVRECLRLAKLPRHTARQPQGANGSRPAWFSWHGRTRRGHSSGATFKLYISPSLEDTRAALHVALPLLLDRCALSVKVGADGPNLLRPDKLVAHFDGFEQLSDAANRLAPLLEGLVPQGVPFTAEFAGEGLMSWGIDPAPQERRQLGLGAESWRYWLVRRLARALAQAASDPPRTVSAEGFALDRLSADGVDVERWVPNDSRWWYGRGG